MKKLAFIAVALLLLAACGPGKYDEFAQCLTDKGATFYGAYWCPHCANQKEMLGSSMKNANYVECSLPNKAGQTQICIDQNITGYPTWEFADGSRTSGVQTLQQLALKTDCKLPE